MAAGVWKPLFGAPCLAGAFFWMAPLFGSGAVWTAKGPHKLFTALENPRPHVLIYNLIQCMSYGVVFSRRQGPSPQAFQLRQPMFNGAEPRPSKPSLPQGTDRSRSTPTRPTRPTRPPKRIRPCFTSPTSPTPPTPPTPPTARRRCAQQKRPSNTRPMRHRLIIQPARLHFECSPALVTLSRHRFLQTGGLSPGTQRCLLHPRPHPSDA